MLICAYFPPALIFNYSLLVGCVVLGYQAGLVKDTRLLYGYLPGRRIYRAWPVWSLQCLLYLCNKSPVFPVYLRPKVRARPAVSMCDSISMLDILLYRLEFVS